MWNNDILESARQAQLEGITNQGIDYDTVQRDICADHVALVDKAPDPDCRVRLEDCYADIIVDHKAQMLSSQPDNEVRLDAAYQGLKTATDMLVEKTNALEFTIAKLDCQPGDTVVFKVPGWAELSWEYRERVVKYVSNMVPDGVKVLFMDKDVELVVVRCDDLTQCNLCGREKQGRCFRAECPQ
jgi:hypothetical protein